jgi:PIN domain nuclease of toxin-antitoxin system
MASGDSGCVRGQVLTVDLLVDTRVFLWWDTKHRRLTKALRAALEDSSNTVFVSAATVWEIGLKRAIGKLEFPDSIEGAITRNGFEPLAVSARHAEAAAALPRYHNDPFDRMLVAQAQLEGMVLVTHDSRMMRYGTPLLGVSSDG